MYCANRCLRDDIIKWKHFPRHCPSCREFTGDRWIPRTKGQWCRVLMFSLICSWTNKRLIKQWRHRRHCKVIILTSRKKKMIFFQWRHNDYFIVLNKSWKVSVLGLSFRQFLLLIWIHIGWSDDITLNGPHLAKPRCISRVNACMLLLLRPSYIYDVFMPRGFVTRVCMHIWNNPGIFTNTRCRMVICSTYIEVHISYISMYMA